MDPVAIKLEQLIGLQLLGGVVLLVGIGMFFAGLAGKIHFIVELPGIKAKLKNAAPGAFVALIGLGMTYLSVQSKVVRIEETTTPGPQVPGAIAPSQQEPGGNPPQGPKMTRTTITEVQAHYPSWLREGWRKVWKDER